MAAKGEKVTDSFAFRLPATCGTLQNHDKFWSGQASNQGRKGINMKKKIDIRSLVLGALLGMAIVFSVAAANEERTVWEYKVVAGTVLGTEGPLDSVINRTVNEGWQFVSASHSTERYGFAVMRREKK